MFRQRIYDASLVLKTSGGANVTTSAMATKNGAVVTLDVGTGWMQGVLRVDLNPAGTTQSFTAANGNRARIQLRGSNTKTFTSERILTEICIGTPLPGRDSASIGTMDPATAYTLLSPFTNEFNGTVYQYLRLYHVFMGTWATGIDYSAFISKF